MAEKKKKSVGDKLREIRAGNPGSITYYFPDGTALSQKSINREVFTKRVKGKLLPRSVSEVLDLFQDTMWDNGAKYFIID